MATDRGIRITWDSAVITDSKSAEMLARLIAACEVAGTITVTYGTTYAAGSGATDNVSVALS